MALTQEQEEQYREYKTIILTRIREYGKLTALLYPMMPGAEGMLLIEIKEAFQRGLQEGIDEKK